MQYDPTTDNYFRAEGKTGGPLYPYTNFSEVYAELYQSGKNEYNEDENKSNKNEESEPIKKKRGRKPKSYYKQIEEERQL